MQFRIFSQYCCLLKVKKNSYQNPSNLVNHARSEQEFSKMRNSNEFDSKFVKNFLKGTSSSAENEDILERLKMADLLDKEYFLEEVIYQLARVMFSQSMTKGSPEAETALHKLVAFLQKQVKNGQISRNLEKKLLGNIELILKTRFCEFLLIIGQSMRGHLRFNSILILIRFSCSVFCFDGYFCRADRVNG